MKLLIADDNKEIRLMIKNISKKYFNEIIDCSDGTDAVKLFKKHEPDWVIMDIKMNKMDGFTSTRKILEENPKAKIIIVSQYKDKSFKDEAAESGALKFVEKENLLEIFEIIKKYSSMKVDQEH